MSENESTRRQPNRRIAAAMLFVACLLSSLLTCTARAFEPVRIGVLSYRPNAQTLAQWQPLAAALKKDIPERDFIVEALDHAQLEIAVASRQVDFVLTNPAHYILLSRRSGLSSPLATLVETENGRAINVFGGVIFSRAGQKIDSLGDIRGKTIAAIDTESFGGYQAQAYELLQAGVHLPQEAKLLATLAPQDKVVDAVLSGRADVGFVRSGLLEAMAREGKLDMKRIEIINRQNLPGFPTLVSTRLYPQWPFAAMPHIDENLARQVAAALFRLEENTAATRAMNIHGFVVPADYTQIVDLLRELRLPPFEQAPSFTWSDVWKRYRAEIMLALMAGGLILLLSFYLWTLNRRLQAEKSLVLLQQQKLQQSEARWQFALEGAGDGVWDWDINSGKTLFSKSWKEMIGYNEDEFDNTFDAWKQHIHPDDVDGFMEAIQRHFDGKAKDCQVEFRLRCKDGSWKWILARGKVVGRDPDGKPLRMIGTHADISGRKRFEDELRRYKDHLEDEVQQRTADLVLARNEAEGANRAKSTFLANMSHELRTPLNAILGFSNILRRDPLLAEEQRSNLDIINRSGEHLLKLINDVLEMAKIESGRVQLENAPFDLGALVRDVSDMMQVRAREKDLRLLIDQSSEFPRYIKGDEARLRQVLINLVGNAVKFTSNGGVTLRLGVKPRASGQHLLIEVEDSGIGIRLDDQQRIFEPFVQLGENAMQKGTGLGLTLTRQYVQLMGGEIEVESTPGKGSIFRIDLPLEKAAPLDVSKHKILPKGEIAALAPGQPEYRILIVEDQLENQLLLGKLMKNIGCQVKVAENGEQAIELFKSWRPQLIWMDRRMPVMDGLDATRRIRQLPGGREVKIVAVTASAFKEQREEILKAGMDDFVRKPYRFDEIYDSLSRQLGARYIYAETGAAKEAGETVLTAPMLAVLPDDLRGELKDALESLESERIAAAVDRVATHDVKLHQQLVQLVDNFDYPAILKALQGNSADD